MTERRPIRINRFLAEAGVAARRKADLLIAERRVTVNGIPAQIGQTVVPGRDVVLVDGVPVAMPAQKRWYLLYKPAGPLSAASDRRGRSTVLDLFPDAAGLFPVGRLDREVTGVLLVTDDGETAYRLTHPRFGIEKTYRVVVAPPFSRDDARRITGGIEIGGIVYRAKTVRIVGRAPHAVTIEMTLTEGRKHEVKELIKAVGSHVIVLERISFAGLTAAGLKPGAYRPLTDAEIEHLKKLTGEHA